MSLMDKTLMDMIARIEGKVDNIVKVLELADKIGEQEPNVEPEETVKILDENNKIRTELLPDLCKTNDITSRQYIKLEKEVGTYELTSGTITKEGKKATFEIKDSDSFTVQLLQTDTTLPVISIRSQDGETNYFNVDYQVDDEWTPFLNDGDKTVYYYNYATIDVAKIIIPEELHDTALQITFGDTYETISTLTHTDGLKIKGNLTVSDNLILENKNITEELENKQDQINELLTQNENIISYSDYWMCDDETLYDKKVNFGPEIILNNAKWYSYYKISSKYELIIQFLSTTGIFNTTFAIKKEDGNIVTDLNYAVIQTKTTFVQDQKTDILLYKKYFTFDLRTIDPPTYTIQNAILYIGENNNEIKLTTVTKQAGQPYKNGIYTYNRLMNMFHPVGSIFISIKDTNPAEFIGGTWTTITSPIEGSYAWKRTN